MKAKSLFSSLLNNWFAKSVCLIVAVVLYLFCRAARIEKRTFSVPLKKVENGSLVCASVIPSHINVIVRSENNEVNNITAQSIEASLDVSYYTREGEYDVPVTLSLNSDVYSTEPVELTVEKDSFKVKLEERTRKTVPINIPYSGDPLHGYELKELKVNPSTAVISGPRGMVEAVNQVYTEDIILTDLKESFNVEKRLRNVNRLVEIVSPGLVTINVTFQASLVNKDFNDCKVFFAQLAPELIVEEVPSVSFSVSGAELVLEKFYPSDYTVQVDCSGITVPGEYELPVVIAVQDAIKIESISQEKVKIKIVEKPQETPEQDAESLENSKDKENKKDKNNKDETSLESDAEKTE